MWFILENGAVYDSRDMRSNSKQQAGGPAFSGSAFTSSKS